MRDLQKILQQFDEPFEMDYCEEFDEIKSAMEHCDKYLKRFNKMNFRSGNEYSINELAQRLQGMLIDRGYIDEGTKEPVPKYYPIMRKITLFLFFNTDIIHKYCLKTNSLVSHVVHVFPMIPKFLFVSLVWELKLDRFFYELLSYSPCWMTFQLFESASDSLKYIIDPYIVLEKVEQLARAINLSMARSSLIELDKIDGKIIFGRMNDAAMNLLRQFHTPDAEKFKNFKKEELQRYAGFAIKYMLQMILYAFDLYENGTLATKTEFNAEIYVICQKKTLNAINPIESTILKEHQMYIITALLSSLQNHLLVLTTEVFIYWMEIDITPMLALQQVVGELAHNVLARMRSNDGFAHDVEQHLSLIAYRPKRVEETVAEATLGDILRALDQPLEPIVKQTWFNEFFNRGTAMGNSECREAMMENIKLMTVDNCKKIIDFIKLDIESCNAERIAYEAAIEAGETNVDVAIFDESVYEELSTIILLSLPQFNTDMLLQLFEHHKKVMDPLNVCDYAKRIDFEQRTTQFLNKYTTIFDIQQFLVLCFENPTVMWSKFFDSACHNTEHVRNFCATVKRTKPISTEYFQRMLDAAMSDNIKMQDKLFPELLCEIYFVLYHPNNIIDFLKQFVNKVVSDLLAIQNFDGLLTIVKMLNLLQRYKEAQLNIPINFGDFTSPILLVAARIMDKARWDASTYTIVRDDVVRGCIKFIQETSKKFLPYATEKDRKWISKVIMDTYPLLTQYYFQKFPLLPNQPQIDFDRFLSPAEFIDKADAEKFLIQTFVRCTMKETEWLARSERLQPHISDVMLKLQMLTKLDSPNALVCYRHSFSNYSNIVLKCLIPKADGHTDMVEKLTMDVLRVIQSIPIQQLYEDVFMNFESVLMNILTIGEPQITDNMKAKIKTYVKSMKDCTAKGVFLQKLDDMAN